MFFRSCVIAVVCLAGFMSLSAFAQEDAEGTSDDQPASYVASTAENPEIAIGDLTIMVRPLTKSELDTEASAWFDLLRAKAKDIAEARLAAKSGATDIPSSDGEDSATAPESEPPDEATIIQMQSARTALSDRLEVVLHSLEQKGGDPKEYRDYIFAVSGIELDTSDAKSVLSGIIEWAKSIEGGRRWMWNFVKFALILFVSWILARVVTRFINWFFERSAKLSKLAERLISSTIRNIFLFIGFAIALTALEVDITPLIAAIGATGLVVGLALQGTLSNFASGLLILINRPFDVGDVVSAGGITGTVDQMNLVSTRFKTFDNQSIYVPNNEIWNNVITNITANDTRRVDLEFRTGYDDDFERAESIIRDVVLGHELVLDDPEPTVITHSLADSSVNIVCRPWAKTSDWWTVKTEVTRAVKRRFDEEGIRIPFAQQDVHIHQVTGSD